eukprot:c8792_g1_i1 orf=293-694(+)
MLWNLPNSQLPKPYSGIRLLLRSDRQVKLLTNQLLTSKRGRPTCLPPYTPHRRSERAPLLTQSTIVVVSVGQLGKATPQFPETRRKPNAKGWGGGKGIANEGQKFVWLVAIRARGPNTKGCYSGKQVPEVAGV